MARTLYLKSLTVKKLSQIWGEPAAIIGKRGGFNAKCYIASNKAGTINWQKNLVYNAQEIVDLIEKGRPVVITKAKF